MRDWLCRDIGKCDRNNGDAYNSLWHCEEPEYPTARFVCGGQDSCVIDKFNWQWTCRGGGYC